MKKKYGIDPNPGSGTNISDHCSEQFLGLLINKFFDADPDPGFGIS
jgi:hypothetical protein